MLFCARVPDSFQGCRTVLVHKCIQCFPRWFVLNAMEMVQAHSGACAAIGLSDLSRSLQTLSGDSPADPADILAIICPSLASAFFPRQGIFPVSHTIAIMQQVAKFIACLIDLYWVRLLSASMP